MFLRQRRWWVGAVALLVFGALLSPPATAASPPRGTGMLGGLRGVSAVSSSDAWAVGSVYNATGRGSTLVMHWNGTAWSRATSPSPGVSSRLWDVSAASSTDVWAVGSYRDSDDIDWSLILHWNGSAWLQVTSPGAFLSSVSAISSSAAFAAGTYVNQRNGRYRTMVLRWDGAAWSKLPAPTSNKVGGWLNGISATSPTDVWTAGERINSAGSQKGMMIHWDGTAWKRTIPPQPALRRRDLNDVIALSASDAWAVGDYRELDHLGQDGPSRRLLEHLEGTTWTQVADPHPTSTILYLNAVTGRPGGDLWIAGERYTGLSSSPLIDHWNGTTWSSVLGPEPADGVYAPLWGVAEVAPNDVWAVGQYSSSSDESTHVLIEHWNGTRWSLK